MAFVCGKRECTARLSWTLSSSSGVGGPDVSAAICRFQTKALVAMVGTCEDELSWAPSALARFGQGGSSSAGMVRRAPTRAGQRRLKEQSNGWTVGELAA